MRNYLSEFFKQGNYEVEDAAYLLEIYDKIVADSETKALWQQALSLYDADCNCDYEAIIKAANDVAEKLYLYEYVTELLIFICMTKRAKEWYRSKGVSDAIFYDTMLDLRYKLEECKLVYGIIGTFVSRWFIGFFQVARFTLGRLQFEVVNFKGNYEKDGKTLTPESKVINVHIPRTQTPLSEESCREAYALAKEFFADQVGADCAFVCRSWMLYPENKNILPRHTNTYRFFSEYDIVSSGIFKDNEDLWRLFDTKERHIDRLPADSSMRRAYVEHLKQGGKTGWGYGVFFA